jgi:hypothetical protein
LRVVGPRACGKDQGEIGVMAFGPQFSSSRLFETIKTDEKERKKSKEKKADEKKAKESDAKIHLMQIQITTRARHSSRPLKFNNCAVGSKPCAMAQKTLQTTLSKNFLSIFFMP